jgi:chromatin remodeling complex protein RSC6
MPPATSDEGEDPPPLPEAPVASTSNGVSAPPIKRKRSPSADGVGPSSPAFALAATKSATKPKVKAEPVVARAKTEMTDEELARQLHNEMNARSSRSGRPRAAAPSSRSAGSKGKKSSQYVDDSDDDDDDNDGIVDMDGTAKPKKKVKRERDPNKPVSQTGFNKPVRAFSCTLDGCAHHRPQWGLSPELAAIVGADQMSRGQVCVPSARRPTCST